MISTPHHLATEAGSRILEHGGSAVDAAIAASAVLCVSYPHMLSLGGDSWSLVADAGSVRAVDGTGSAPAGLSAARVRAEGHESMPAQGPHTVTVPGMVAAWGLLHEEFGRLPCTALLAEAISLAQAGVAVSSSLARDIRANRETLAADPGCAALFLTEERMPKAEGDRLVQPALARTLRTLAIEGFSALYTGDLGRAYAAGLAGLGSTLTDRDLARHGTRFRDPIVGRYRGAEIYTTPPNSQGFVLLQLLAAAERLGGEWSAGDLLGRLPLAAVAFGDDRDACLADPGRMSASVESLLADHRIDRALRSGPDDRVAMPRPPVSLGGDTVAVVAIDGNGLAVSMVESVAGAFGAALLEESTGIIAQNRGSAFTLDAGSASLLVGGTKPPHTLMPAIIRRNGSSYAAVGTMGGKGQPVILAQVIDRLLDQDSPQDAVAGPRWVVTAPTGQEAPAILIESGMPETIRAALGASGLRVVVVDEIDNRFGQAQVVVMAGSAFSRGTDPRADGVPLLS
ncbi:MAG: gamma-glutamyltransferase family protein [Microbacteriaceae bacterium]